LLGENTLPNQCPRTRVTDMMMCICKLHYLHRIAIKINSKASAKINLFFTAKRPNRQKFGNALKGRLYILLSRNSIFNCPLGRNLSLHERYTLQLCFLQESSPTGKVQVSNSRKFDPYRVSTGCRYFR